MLRFVEIVLGESGSSRCRRCHSTNAETLRGASEVLANVSDVVRSWTSGPGPNISFTGVEPFIHPRLLGIIAEAAASGVRRIRLHSNAHALVSPDMARTVIESGVRHLLIDMFGSEASLHGALTGSEQGLDDTIKGVTAFRQTAETLGARVHVSARVPVCRHNLQDLPAIVTTAAKGGVRAVTLVVQDEMLNVWSAAPWIEAACDTGIVYASWVDVEGIPFGPARGWELHLASIYHPVAGAKSALCSGCSLDALCGGAAEGASESVTAQLSPPDDADTMAADIARCSLPPEGRRG